MDKIIQIFVKLGVDQSIFYQFALFCIIFMLLKTLFFNKLLFVIQTRESKTTKLDEQATDKFKEAQKLSQEFDQVIQETNEEAHQQMSDYKTKSLKQISEEQRSEEEKILKDYEAQKTKALAEVESKRSDVLGKSEDLAKGLVDKLVN